jgi:hypothetical protein
MTLTASLASKVAAAAPIGGFGTGTEAAVNCLGCGADTALNAPDDGAKPPERLDRDPLLGPDVTFMGIG